MSAIELVAMSEPDARKLTEKIRITAHNYADARAKLTEYVTQAKSGSAHLALGYASWTAYLSEVLGEEPMRLARGERQEMVQMLSAEGMSTRAIAPIVGASVGQVHADKQVFRNEHVDPDAGELSTVPITGLDGRTYTRPEPNVWIEPDERPKSKRRPIAEQARDAGLELMTITDRLQRIANDDRFNANKESIAAHLSGHLTNAINACQGILNQVNN